MKKVVVIVVSIILIGFQSCTWKYDNLIVKDKDGNLYLLDGSGYRHESYDLIPLPTADIDTVLNSN